MAHNWKPNLKEWTAIGLLIYCGSIFGIDSYIRTLLDSRKGRVGGSKDK